MNFSVVIVTYNRLNLLKECISAVSNQTKPFNEVIIVNNNSSDGTKEYLDEIRKNNSKFHIHNLNKNLGGAGGFCYGLSKVGSENDFVLIIDDDAIINNDFIANIENCIVPEVKAYSGVVKTDGVIDTSHRRIISNKLLLFRDDVSKEAYEKEYFDYDFSTFCGLIVSVPLLRQIGLPKKEYFIWNDDSEYSLRIRRHSKIRNVNKAVLNHKTIISYSDKLSWKSYYGYRNFWDMGHIYSSSPVLFDAFRLMFHFARILKFSFSYLISSDKAYAKKVVKLHIDVLKSRFRRRLGVNNEYLYGKW